MEVIQLVEKKEAEIFSEKSTIKEFFVEFFKYIGEDPNREGLLDTPSRVVRSWSELYCGYSQDAEKILSTTFVEGACNEMVVVKDIDFFSTCEHHLIPFSGTVSIGYIPDQKVVGLSKLPRLVEMYARRVQIQEKMTSQIADAIMQHLLPKGCMVIVKAKHLCVGARGVKKQNAAMVTSAIRGNFSEQSIRQEFLELIK